jgi:tight adherence protein B
MEFLIAGFVFAAITAIAWALIQMRAEGHLATQLRLERVAGRLAADWNLSAPMLRGSRLSSIPWIERALQQMDLARSIDLQLIRADWSIRVSEFLAIIAGAAGAGLAVITLISGSLLIGIPFGLVAALVPVFILKRAVAKRRKTLEKQLVETLVLLSNSLKAGFGLLQALDQAARQLDDPIAKELKQTIRDTQMGASIEDAINGLSVRVGSYDLEIVVTAILVQRNVGGNLSEILDSVAHTMRERERIRGEIATLTAQQRLTGFIIAGIPPALAGLFFVMNPDYMITLYEEPIGRMLVAGALVLEIIGAYVIKRIINIEI